MRILIDFTQIPVQKTGVGIYAVNLLKELINNNRSEEIFVTVQDDDAEISQIKNNRVRLIRIKSRIFRRLPFRICFEQIILPFIAFTHKVDIIHSLHYSFPLVCFSKKRIVTIHDLTFFRYPQFHLCIKRNYFKFFIYIAHHFVNKIIVVSESTKKDLVKFTNTRSELVSVIHLGCTEEMPEISKADIEKVRRKYALPDKYLLNLGVIEPRKNIIRLILAFHKIQEYQKEYCLVIAGKKGWLYKDVFLLIKKLELEKKVIFVGFVEEKDKYVLMKGAKIFIYSSVFEGFGLPVIEAMNLGIPTIANNGSSISEFAKKGAILVNTKNVDTISTAICQLINDQELYRHVSKRSKLITKQFTWRETARKTVQEYNSI